MDTPEEKPIKAAPPTKRRVADNIYQDDHGRFYERVTLERNGRKYRTEKRLHARTIAEAVTLHQTRQTDRARSKMGLCRNPDEKLPETITLEFLAGRFMAAGCPDRNDAKLSDAKKKLYLENRIETILKFWGPRTVQDITPREWKKYREWRGKNVKPDLENRNPRDTGDRTTDQDRNTLSRIIDWAFENELLKYPNPFGKAFRTFAKNAVHCRDLRPENADEIHLVANYFFDSPKSESVGWQYLFELVTGCRTHEILKMRLDASSQSQPGFIKDDILYIKRSKGGIKNYIEIDETLKQVLEGFRAWHQDKFPNSPWYFPSHRGGSNDPLTKGQNPLTKGALVHALKRAVEDLNTGSDGKPLKEPRIKGHRTSHGCRAYRVCVLRSEGKDDHTIANMLGQRTGGSLIVQVYGEFTPMKLGYTPSPVNPKDYEGLSPEQAQEKLRRRVAWRRWLTGNAEIIPMPAAANAAE